MEEEGRNVAEVVKTRGLSGATSVRKAYGEEIIYSSRLRQRALMSLLLNKVLKTTIENIQTMHKRNIPKESVQTSINNNTLKCKYN